MSRRQKALFEDWRPKLEPVPVWQQVRDMDRQGLTTRQIAAALDLPYGRIIHERVTARTYAVREERRR